MISLDAISKADQEFAANYGLFFAETYNGEENLKKYGSMMIDTVDGPTWKPWEGKEAPYHRAMSRAGESKNRRGPPAFIQVQ